MKEVHIRTGFNEILKVDIRIFIFQVTFLVYFIKFSFLKYKLLPWNTLTFQSQCRKIHIFIVDFTSVCTREIK